MTRRYRTTTSFFHAPWALRKRSVHIYRSGVTDAYVLNNFTVRQDSRLSRVNAFKLFFTAQINASVRSYDKASDIVVLKNTSCCYKFQNIRKGEITFRLNM